MSPEITRMLRERRLLRNHEAMRRELARIEEVKAAFMEGQMAGLLWSGANPHDQDECWLHSDARKRLYAGPSTPVHLAAKAAARGYPVCQCRRPGGPGNGL